MKRDNRWLIASTVVAASLLVGGAWHAKFIHDRNARMGRYFYVPYGAPEAELSKIRAGRLGWLDQPSIQLNPDGTCFHYKNSGRTRIFESKYTLLGDAITFQYPDGTTLKGRFKDDRLTLENSFGRFAGRQYYVGRRQVQGHVNESYIKQTS